MKKSIKWVFLFCNVASSFASESGRESPVSPLFSIDRQVFRAEDQSETDDFESNEVLTFELERLRKEIISVSGVSAEEADVANTESLLKLISKRDSENSKQIKDIRDLLSRFSPGCLKNDIKTYDAVNSLVAKCRKKDERIKRQEEIIQKVREEMLTLFPGIESNRGAIILAEKLNENVKKIERQNHLLKCCLFASAGAAITWKALRWCS